MLKCGECTFFKEPAPGTGGDCEHPEMHTDKTFRTHIPLNYEDDCRFGYCDIWAARGAAKLVHIAKKPAKKNTPETSSGLVGSITQTPMPPMKKLNPGDLLGIAAAGAIVEYLFKKGF